MDQRELSGLLLFQTVAEEGSFTGAARRLGRSQSGLSQAISNLETQMGVTLLSRSTRSVRPTAAGLALLETIVPALREIESRLVEVKQTEGAIAGTLRLSVTEFPARTILVPSLPGFLAAHPRLSIDLDVSDRFVDIVADGFDAGIRLGTHLEQDMISVPLSSDVQAVVVGSPNYFSRHGVPERLEDLSSHICLNYRQPSHGDIYKWRFVHDGRQVELPLSGNIVTNDRHVMTRAAIAGLGLAYVFRPYVSEELADGQLINCLSNFCPIWPGYSLYYPARSQKSTALAALIQHLKKSVDRAVDLESIK
ncbi:LysR family transcriptional regulator [Celeribacter sp.]|uniref:LysR family transcriptional regulator n=1 Tax=Celeribacter sp. TaxID=1890673 RepID=UPI003A957B0B